jgi:hypothetical protein
MSSGDRTVLRALCEWARTAVFRANRVVRGRVADREEAVRARAHLAAPAQGLAGDTAESPPRSQWPAKMSYALAYWDTRNLVPQRDREVARMLDEGPSYPAESDDSDRAPQD